MACSMACSPTGANTCPAGFFCNSSTMKCDEQCTQGGNQCGGGYTCSPDGQCLQNGACQGLQCQQVSCSGGAPDATAITGTVFAPNGTLPLYGINVYVPLNDPGAFPAGLQCDQCSASLPGNPLVKTVTDEAGNFTLKNMPVGANIPVVITTGKWRRIINLPNVGKCTSTPVVAADTTLPKSADDMTPNTKSVDMPKIALTTGNADSLECLIRKLGVADKEITNSAGPGHVHFYVGNGVGQFDNGWPGGSGQMLTDATPFWSAAASLEAYDIVILSCEGAQNPQTKPQAALDAMKAYADAGGRVFASHWHNIWIEGSTQGGGNQAPAVWPGIATWSNGGNLNNGTIDLIDEANNPKGPSFATWMLNVMGSTTRDQIAIQDGTGRSTCNQVDNLKGERWTYVQGQGGTTQNFQFTTPNESDPSVRCGKVVFSDMHVSGGPMNGNYPSSCGSSLTLTPQEKALAFMFFDIASCVSNIP